ncbi:MAG: AI-2E family transporter [Clostridia bacterium]|nr:AI-2E family transporter [Clostridia bacterium]
MSNKEPQEHPLAKWFGERRFVRLMLLAALLTLGVIHIQWIIAGIGFLWNVARPLIVGTAIAYFLAIIMKRLEMLIFPRATTPWLVRSRRLMAMLIALCLIVLVFVLLIFTVIPGLAEAVTLLARELPVYFAQAKQWALDMLQDVPTVRDYLAALEFDWQSVQDRLIGWAVNGIGGQGLLSSTVSVIGAVTGQVANFFISIIFAIFLLGSKRQLQHQFRKLLQALFNDEHEQRIQHILTTANRCFSGFIIGQTVNGLILGMLTWLGMRIFGMPYALMVGVLSGTTSLIPIIGGYIGAALGTFLVFTANPSLALWFLLFIVALQTLQGNTLYPRLLGSSVGIPSLWVVAAITVGGGIGGIGGMLLSVPITATIYALTHEWVRKTNGDPPLEVQPAEPTWKDLLPKKMQNAHPSTQKKNANGQKK